MTFFIPPQSRYSCSALISPVSQTALGPSEAPQRPERNARASTVSNRTGETDATYQAVDRVTVQERWA